MTSHPDLFAALAAPFNSDEVKTRPQGGRQLPYVTARVVMNRLDDALGPENWWDDYTPLEHSVICRLTIRLPDGTVLTKGDAGGHAGMADPGDDEKSGFADAFKRAAVKFGVGRYLYRDGIPKFAREVLSRHANGRASQAQPVRAEPVREAPAAAPGPTPAPVAGAPKDARSFYLWVKDRPEVLKRVIAWAKGNGLPSRIVDWEQEDVERAWYEATTTAEAARPSHH